MKNLIYLFAAVIMFAFTACGGGEATEEVVAEEVAVEEVAPEVVAEEVAADSTETEAEAETAD